MSASTLRWVWRSLLVAAIIAVRGNLVNGNGTPLLLSSILGFCTYLGRIVALLLVVESSGLAVVVVLLFPAVVGVVPMFSAVASPRCFRCHGYTATNDLGTAVARKDHPKQRWRIVFCV